MTNENPTAFTMPGVIGQANAQARRFLEKARGCREAPLSLISPEFFEAWPIELGDPPEAQLRAFFSLHDELRAEVDDQAAEERAACARISSKFAALSAMATALDMIADSRRVRKVTTPKRAPKLRVV